MTQLKSSTLIMLAAIALALIGYVSLTLIAPVFLGKKHLIDFDIFYLVSTLIGEGNLRAAYAPAEFLPRQAQVPGYDGGEMFWSYPPHFNLVVAPLAGLPLPLSYALFMVATLAFYVLVLRALAGPGFHAIIVLFFPLMLLIIRSGQNSFITGGLIGFTCLLILRRSGWAAVPLGLMAIKPHLALGVGIWSLINRQWGLAARSLAVVAMMSLLATLAFGTDVWPTSLSAIAGTAEVLREGRFPLFRMTSIYASALSFGMEHQLAIYLHFTSVAMALAALAALCRAKPPLQVTLGAGVLVSALISPYNYDYDLAMLAAAACLLIGTVMRYASQIEKYTIAAVTLCIGTYGIAVTAYMDVIRSDQAARPVSVLGPVILIGSIVLFRVIWRCRETTRSEEPQSALSAKERV